MKMDNKSFFIYNDAGAHKRCVRQWCKRISELTCTTAHLVSCDDILNGRLQDAQVFIMPGGADLPYCEKLNGIGNRNISAFVHAGGLYIGSCAGAYYAHEAIDWHNEHECIAGPRELAFFKGTARGPLVTPYHAVTNEGLAFVPLHYKGKTAHVYYKGGPVMQVCDETERIAEFCYKNVQYPAVIKRNIGRGTAIAISPHIEYTDSFLDSLKAPPCPHRSTLFFAIMTDVLCH